METLSGCNGDLPKRDVMVFSVAQHVPGMEHVSCVFLFLLIIHIDQ